jgi:dephospho-CoA kinase
MNCSPLPASPEARTARARPFAIGLTGGIGSGKSTVAALLRERGAGLIDADAISRALTGPGGAALAAIVAAFGPQALDAEGALDRPAMRQRIFADPADRASLEGILHPMIRQAAQRQVDSMAAHLPYLVHDIPLLVEAAARGPRLDRVLVVDCPLALQVARAMARSGLAHDEVLAIAARQADRGERLAAADDIVFNGAGLDALAVAVDRLHAYYLDLARTATGPRR